MGLPELPATAWGGKIRANYSPIKTEELVRDAKEEKLPNSIQPREYSKGGGIGGMAHEICTVNVNWNGDGWNLNANPIDNPNEWNDGNQVFSRNYLFSSPTLVGGVFCEV